MVIQRWQTLLLLIAVILMGCLSITPLATSSAQGTALFISDFPVLLIVDILIAVILFIAIFMFKNLRSQMKVTLLSIILMCSLVVGGFFTLSHNSPEAEILITGAVLLLLIAAVLTIGAYRLMRRDYRLLRSADRLR